MNKLNLFFSILIALIISACSPSGKAKDYNDNLGPQGDIGTIFGDSMTFGGPDKAGKNGTGSNIAVNSFLWRASLDTLSFMPLNQVDPFGGVILSDWYSTPESPTERYKLNVYILTRALRSDGVKVSVFKQMRSASNEWQDVGVNKDTATQIENSILTRARQMRINFQSQIE